MASTDFDLRCSARRGEGNGVGCRPKSKAFGCRETGLGSENRSNFAVMTTASVEMIVKWPIISASPLVPLIDQVTRFGSIHEIERPGKNSEKTAFLQV